MVYQSYGTMLDKPNNVAKKIILEYQETADMLNLDYSAEMLYKAYTNQYNAFSDRKCRQTDYVCCQMNTLLEVMKAYYGITGGGRRNGRMHNQYDIYCVGDT
jgi:hypothetical protein